MAALICWAVPLNLWTGVQFFEIFEKMFYHTNRYAYHSRDISIFIATGIAIKYLSFLGCLGCYWRTAQNNIEFVHYQKHWSICLLEFSAMFIFFYFIVLLTYRIINRNELRTKASNDIRLYITNGTFDWKITAMAANFYIMAFSVGQTAFFLSRVFPETTETFLFAIFLIFGEFLVVSMFWLLSSHAWAIGNSPQEEEKSKFF